MAKLAFSKLGLKVKNENKLLTFNEQNIELKTYLSIQDKLNIITNAMMMEYENNSNKFINIPMLKMFVDLEIVYAYTNLSFTEKQKEEFIKTYDCLCSSGLLDMIYEYIPNEYDYIINNTLKSAMSAYDYNNSIYGILDSLQRDYNGLNFNAAEIQQKLADPENMDLLKQILTKLG